MVIYTVRPGDSVYSIARKYGVSPQTIITNNNIQNDRRLMVGQALIVDTGDVRHRVTAGQTLYSLARMYGTTVNSILAANPGVNPERLQIGQTLVIPTDPQEKRTIDVNGYAFPNINRDTLNRTLPNLTYLSIFSYQVKPDGSLIPINDTPLIQSARQRDVAPMMVITNILEGGSFNSDLAHTILTSESVQDTLLNNVLQTLRTKNYYGLDIDFEFILPDDREEYNNFLRKAVNKLRPLGYTITTALAPKLRGDQPGLLYEAHDYPVHGELVDHVIIMTYEWGYTYV
ncbi:MAG: glycoside hydrolase [Oscillospiraceae bacterium]|nr:glycoside hydrolase [Oscillospiraceae bacterium]